MKQLFILLLMSQLTQAAFAQTTRFGLQGGAHLSIINSGSGFSIFDGQLFSYSAGVLLDQPLFRNIIFQPELNWIHKGGKNTFFIDDRYDLNYVELPLKIIYRTRHQYGFFIGGGPNLSYGISGTLKTADDSFPIHFSGSWHEYGTPWELGLHLVTGYLTQGGWQLSVTYATSSIHIARMGPSSAFDNMYLGIRVAYLLQPKGARQKNTANQIAH